MDVFLRAVPGLRVNYVHDEWQRGSEVRDTLPRVPCTLIERKKDGATSVERSLDAGWPQELERPLLKCSSPTSLKGRASGVRSCVFRHRSGLFRLKGCGNNTEGIVRNAAGALRGVAFRHTALLECFNTCELRRLLGECVCANEPLGFWLYEHAGEEEAACAVFRTLGDARLGSQLLGGLQTRWETLTQWDEEGPLHDLFPPRRWRHGELLGAAELMVDHCLAVEYGEASHGVDFPSLDRYDASLYADCRGMFGGALPYLFSRIGFEAGEFLRRLHAAGYSWGTYEDELCFPGQLHCNAHSDNFVVLPDHQTRLLAYLDLDMAFPTSDAALLYREHVLFCEVLVGAEMSSGVVREQRSEPLGGNELLGFQACQDLMLQSYLRAYRQDNSFACCEWDAELHAQAQALYSAWLCPGKGL